VPAPTLSEVTAHDGGCSCHVDTEPARRISRRSVVKGAGALATVAVAAPGFGSVAFASNNANRVGDVVVNIFMRGGMDGLSVVVPRHEGAGAGFLAAARPDLAVDPASVLPLNDDFGLHPAMASLLPVWNAGGLALVPAAGFIQSNRSHFTVQRQMDLGVDLGVGSGSGWLARHLDVTNSPAPVGLRATALPRAQRSLSGSTVSVAIRNVDDFEINGFRGAGAAVQAALADLHAVDGGGIVDRRAHEALVALDLVNNAETTPPANGAMYPSSGRGRNVGRVLAEIASLIRADVGLEAVATEANFGWDLHENFGNQVDGRQSQNLAALADVLGAFWTDLGPMADRVTVVLMTEFGRTFRQNGNAGVDHGRASTMMVMGGGINGDLYGDWPGLAPDDIDRNALRVTTDYRSVLADVLENRLATGNLAAVLPGYEHTPDKRLGLAQPISVT
jgi:uncharacterized protein (DUF1501 family)